MTKDLVTKPTTAMTTTNDDSAIQGLTFQDVGISRIQLAQAMSETTAEGKTTPGDLYDGTTKQVVAKKGSTLDIVVLSGNKTFIHSKNINGTFEFQFIEPATAANADQPWTYSRDGMQWKATQCLNFFILPVKALEKEKEILEALKKGKDLPSDVELLKPSIVTFRGASYKTGKQIINHLMAIEQFKRRGLEVDGLSTIWKLGSTTEKNDKATYQVLTLTKASEKLPKDFVEICKGWQLTIQNSQNLKTPPPETEATGPVADVTSGEVF